MFVVANPLLLTFDAYQILKHIDTGVIAGQPQGLKVQLRASLNVVLFF